MSTTRPDDVVALESLKANGAGSGLFQPAASASSRYKNPFELPEGSLAAIAVDEAEIKAATATLGLAAKTPGPARWKPVALAAVALAAVAPLLTMAPRGGRTASASGSAQEAPRQVRDRVHATHGMTARGMYMELDESAQKSARAIARAAQSDAPATDEGVYVPEPAAQAPAKPAVKRNALADFGNLGSAPAPVVQMTAMQTSAAKREASFMDLTRHVRRVCRASAESAPLNVSVRAFVKVNGTGAASDLRLESNWAAAAACIDREIRGYAFAPEAFGGAMEIPFSWRKQ